MIKRCSISTKFYCVFFEFIVQSLTIAGQFGLCYFRRFNTALLACESLGLFQSFFYAKSCNTISLFLCVTLYFCFRCTLTQAICIAFESSIVNFVKGAITLTGSQQLADFFVCYWLKIHPLDCAIPHYYPPLLSSSRIQFKIRFLFITNVCNR